MYCQNLWYLADSSKAIVASRVHPTTGLALDVDDGREEDACAGDIRLSPRASAMGSFLKGLLTPYHRHFVDLAADPGLRTSL